MKNLLFEFIENYVPLTAEEREMIVSLDIFRTVKKGTVLLEEGQTANYGYFVLKGCIRTYYVINGEEKTTNFYTEMEGITPHCVISNKPSEYFVSALEDSIITVSNPNLEEDMFEKFPKFETVCRLVSEELLAEEQVSHFEFKTSNPEQRYLNLLKDKPSLIQRVPQRQLASYLGITPQSLSRLRARISKGSKE